MDKKDDIKNTEKYMDDSVLHKSDSDQDISSDEEVAPKRQTRRRRTKAQKPKGEEHPEDPPEPKPRRQSKPPRDGAPPKKKQSRDRERPAAVKKYEPKHESELSKSESMVDPPKRSRGRPRLTEAEKQLRRLCSAAEKKYKFVDSAQDFIFKVVALANEHNIEGVAVMHTGPYIIN